MPSEYVICIIFLNCLGLNRVRAFVE